MLPTINEAKSAVASVFGRKFLGYSLWVAAGRVIKRKVAVKPLATFKHRVRELMRRGGCSLAQTPGVMLELEEWVRHRLRAIQLKHWKHGATYDVYGRVCMVRDVAEVAHQTAY